MCTALLNGGAIKRQLAPFSTEASMNHEQFMAELAEKMGRDPEETRDPTSWHRAPIKLRKSRFINV